MPRLPQDLTPGLCGLEQSQSLLPPPNPAGKQGPEQDMLIPQPVGTPPQALRATGSPSGELPL